ncbi:hypothetical protein [Eubacterium aggregans]|uniref:hypothetical protein n=1 Tax=Eubacterium aggregans TaxID=81409 RepID=UPI003F2A0FBC
MAVNNDVYDVPGNCRHNADETTTTARQDVDKTLEQVRLGKVSIGKDRLGKVTKEEPADSSVQKHEIPKPSPLKVESEEVEAYFTTPKVNKAFNEFLKTRKDLKVKNTDRAVKLLVDKLTPFPPDAQYEAITESIMNGWKGVFPQNGEKSGKGIEQNPFVDFIEGEDSPAFTQLFNQENYTIE